MFGNRGTEVFSRVPQSRRTRATLLALKVLGAVSWTCAYHEASRVARRIGRPVLPEAAIVANLTWESIYAAGGVWKWRTLSVEDKVQTVINVVWLASDVRFARSLPGSSRRMIPYLVPAILYQAVFLAGYPPGKAARISALWQNLGFSAYCALTVSATGQTSASSLRFTMLRAVGTVIPTLTSGAFRGIEPTYLVPGAACVGFDLLRIIRERAILEEAE